MSLHAAALAAGALLLVLPSLASASVIYDSIPSPMPGSSPSLGFQATQTAEFGDYVEFAGSERILTSVDVLLNSWACQEGGWNTHDCANPDAGSTGYDHPITLNIYQVDAGGNPGALITSVTQTVHVPWRPASDTVNCTNGGYLPDCSNGYNFVVSFAIPGNIVVPDKVAYGVAFNTETWGADPVGATGPYNSLNVSVPDVSPSVGIDSDPDAVLWNTHTTGYYSTPCPGDTFCRDTGWSGNVPAARFNATSMPIMNGGGHLLDENGKRKNWKDLSFGTELSTNGGSDYTGSLDVVFHNVGVHSLDKTSFHGTQVTSVNLFAPDSASCESAMNMTVLGSWNGTPGYKAIFRAGNSSAPASTNPDTVRITLYDAANHVVYDTHPDFPDESGCVGTARTTLDTGNITIYR